MISFKQFLLEGGSATSKHETSRASQADIQAVLQFISNKLDIPIQELKKDLLGTTELAHLGKKKDAGDVDIALSTNDYDVQEINKKMLAATGNKGGYNAGTKIGSYAVPVNGKRIQVDLMFVKNKNWAKWIYHSSHEAGSAYPGAVRNILLFTALAHIQEPGKDFVLRDGEGKSIVRASKSVKMDVGMERLFKMAKYNPKTGKYAKTVKLVDPKEIQQHLNDIGEKIEFSNKSDLTDNPEHVAQFIFGKHVKAKDLMTAENVIKQIHNIKNLNLQKQIIKACKSELTRLKLPVPREL